MKRNAGPDIIAIVSFRSTAEGGRNGPTPGSQFGCPAEIEGQYFDCWLDLSAVGSIAPGDTATIPMSFLSPDIVRPKLRKGVRFTLWELRTIADVIVEEILPRSLQ